MCSSIWRLRTTTMKGAHCMLLTCHLLTDQLIGLKTNSSNWTSWRKPWLTSTQLTSTTPICWKKSQKNLIELKASQPQTSPSESWENSSMPLMSKWTNDKKNEWAYVIQRARFTGRWRDISLVEHYSNYIITNKITQPALRVWGVREDWGWGFMFNISPPCSMVCQSLEQKT